MSNVTYDMDTSGGLMPLIRALIKPPDEEPSVPKPKKSHPYYKRPGKGHNHDSCDACGEGGDLICCDRCPASFHLGCYDPPLDENDIPAGLWLCRECRASDAEKPASARGSRAQSPADSKSDTEKKTRSLRSRDSAKKRSKEDSSDSEKEKEKEKEKEEKDLTPMEILVKAARIMNPTQFELPREMRIPIMFPGTDKEGGGVVSLEGGLVPLPARACFVCRATCRRAPLLQCDYCPLLFHQDCLDPPLTALPTGRWMCPNHAEHCIDWKLVNSVSATERVALWEQISAPVDQHAVKIDFLRQARRYKHNFRQRVPALARGRVRVPAAVRRLYACPPPLLPSRREHVRCRTALQRLKQSGLYSESEDEDAPKHEVCLNLDCQTEHNAPRDEEMEGGGRKGEEEEEDADKHTQRKERDGDSDSSSLSDSELEELTAKRPRRQPAVATALPKLALAAEGRQLLTAIEPQLKQYDEGLLKILAWQRLRQVVAGEQAAGAFGRSPLSAAAARAVLLALPRAPPLPLPSELLSRADRERIATVVWGAPPAPPDLPPDGPTTALAPSLDSYVIAALCPTSGTGRAVGMRRASLACGADSACELQLSARCRRVSGRHAVIFLDEVTRHFELLNYSEWGTLVNGVLYACDARDRPSPSPPGDPSAPSAPEAALRDALRRRRTPSYRINGSVTSPLGAAPCRCPPGPAPGLGPVVPRDQSDQSPGPDPTGPWEGSALLPHGALISFGCQEYVFSITGTAETDDTEPAL